MRKSVLSAFAQNPATGAFDDLVFEVASSDVAFHPNLRPPKSRHYTIGFDQQVGDNMAIGIQYVHKYTDDLIGLIEGHRCASLCIQTHPERWNEPGLGYVRSVLLDGAANTAKRIIRLIRSGHAR